MKQKCDNCKFSTSDDEAYECHRHSPSNADGEPSWPMVWPDEWCCDWEGKEA